MASVFFVTGTDTGVGKTVLACWLVRWWLEQGVRVAAAKPLASGGRNDARALVCALGKGATIEAVNPWWFRPGLTPLLAARHEGRRVSLPEVLRFLGERRLQADILVVEGAGGLRSPLGEDWDALDLILGLDAVPVVVAANRLGCLNQIRLTLGAMPGVLARSARVALMSPPRPTVVSRTNAAWLAEALGPDRLARFPWVQGRNAPGGTLPEVARRSFARWWGRSGEAAS